MLPGLESKFHDSSSHPCNAAAGPYPPQIQRGACVFGRLITLSNEMNSTPSTVSKSLALFQDCAHSTSLFCWPRSPFYDTHFLLLLAALANRKKNPLFSYKSLPQSSSHLTQSLGIHHQKLSLPSIVNPAGQHLFKCFKLRIKEANLA